MSAKAPAQRALWHDAYDAQMALWRWYRTEPGIEWCAGCERVAVQGLPDGMASIIHKLWDAETGKLLDCDPFYVSEEMCELVDAARQSFNPEPLMETDLLTPRGFLYFAKPMFMTDRYGMPLSIHAASWGRDYAAKDDEAARIAAGRLLSAIAWKRGDRIQVEEMDAMIEEGLIFPVGIGVCLYAERNHYLDVTRGDAPVEQWVRDDTAATPLLPFHVTPWTFGQTFAGNEVDIEGRETGAAEWWSLLQTTFRLMQQRIAARHVHRPHRSHRREAKAAGLPYEPEVVVVRLRREQSEPTEPTGEEANYSHRFIVSGHWRNQWYSGERVHRQIWISPYVKGPEDKPLIVRPRRVYQWER